LKNQVKEKGRGLKGEKNKKERLSSKKDKRVQKIHGPPSENSGLLRMSPQEKGEHKKKGGKWGKKGHP